MVYSTEHPTYEDEDIVCALYESISRIYYIRVYKESYLIEILYNNDYRLTLQEQEVINSTITMPLEDVSDMTKVYRNSLNARRKFAEKLVTNLDELEDFDIDEEKDINTNVVILNAYLKAMGVRLTFSDQYYTINSYDDNEILDYEDEETGEIVVDTEAGIDRYQIRKKIDDYYTNGIGTYIGTEENYEKLLDMEVENYIAARDDEPLPYPDIENTFDGFE